MKKSPIAICAAVAEIFVGHSHDTLDAMFECAGAPGTPPRAPHSSKWKIWLRQIGSNPDVDSLEIVGNLIEEFMDLPPKDLSELEDYHEQRTRLVNVLEENGLRYYRGGQLLPIDETPIECSAYRQVQKPQLPIKPTSVEELLEIIIRGLPRAMHPLTHRRKGAQNLSFNNEYDIQDLLHSQLRSWISDIRPEEYTPSHAGSSTRMDFLLYDHNIVIETKRVRDKSHAAKIGDELIIDINHYQAHPNCDRLWCVIYDPNKLIVNPSGIVNDLEGERSSGQNKIYIRVFVFV